MRMGKISRRVWTNQTLNMANHSGSSGKIVKLRLSPHQSIARASTDLDEQVRDEHKEYVSDEGSLLFQEKMAFYNRPKLLIGHLTLRLLMSYIYMEHLFLMFLDHTQRRSTVGRTPLDE